MSNRFFSWIKNDDDDDYEDEDVGGISVLQRRLYRLGLTKNVQLVSNVTFVYQASLNVVAVTVKVALYYRQNNDGDDRKKMSHLSVLLG